MLTLSSLKTECFCHSESLCWTADMVGYRPWMLAMKRTLLGWLRSEADSAFMGARAALVGCFAGVGSVLGCCAGGQGSCRTVAMRPTNT